MMSLLPLLFSAWWAELDRPHRLMDQNFGLGLTPEQLLLPSIVDTSFPFSNRGALDFYYRTMNDLMRRGESGT
ncbi:hypothetical protein WN55_01041 [Dufourea novaeangliae]|nr:hypothetical protein WN55_01041 [Dufourea novaeangliae]